MEEEIKILEKYIMDFHKRNKYCIAFREDLLKTAIEHLLQAYTEDEAVIKEMSEYIGRDMRCLRPEIECNKMTHDCKECTESYFRKKVKDERNKV